MKRLDLGKDFKKIKTLFLTSTTFLYTNRDKHKYLFMRLKIYLLTFFLVSLFFTLFSTKTALAASYPLSGSVQDNLGAAIIGATVDIYNQGTTTDVVSPTTTDQSGNYSFTSVPQGTYDIKVTPPSGSNFSPAIALSRNIFSDSILNFVLVSAGTVDGFSDKFRIKITDSSNTVLYDNQIGAADNTSPTQGITNGQIKIH